MSKTVFRAKQLDPSKHMPIYFAEELPDLLEHSAFNRAVPQMPSGMEKEEESEHHLQKAIAAGSTIPTPEVLDVKDIDFCDVNYPADYKMPRQLIYMQPFSMEQEIPDYDMDSSDELWVNSYAKRLEIDPLKFEQMMDRLEKSSGQTVVTLNEAKALLKQDDDVIIAVYDYWLNKRLTTQHPLLLSVKTESRGNTASNDPYLAFRRRTEKMQTRKNRKNDETSYEKMLKLKRDLSRTITLLEMIKRREKIKREHLHLSIEIYEKRYQAQDFSGQMLQEYTAQATKARPAFAPLFTNQFVQQRNAYMSSPSYQWNSSSSTHQNNFSNSSQYYNFYPQVSGNNFNMTKRDMNEMNIGNRKRQYKKRKHKVQREKIVHHIEKSVSGTASGGGAGGVAGGSSDEEEVNNYATSETEDEGSYAFKRNKNCNYYKSYEGGFGTWPWESPECPEDALNRNNYKFQFASVEIPKPKFIGFVRRRIGRGGRVILDRIVLKTKDENYPL